MAREGRGASPPSVVRSAVPVKRKVFEDWNLDLEIAEAGEPSADVVSFRSRALGRDVAVEPSLAHQPDGIQTAALAAGIKYDDVLDFTVVRLDRQGSAAGVFTTNLCPGYAVPYDRRVLADGKAQALLVVSKNANVFTPDGERDVDTMARALAGAIGIAADDVVVSCTGVIGVPLPMAKIEKAIGGVAAKLRPRALDDASRAILTTDRGPKVCSVRIGDVVVCAMAKGAGMIEPNMATMLVYFFTNADLDGAGLREVLTGAVDRTFNSLSVDSDTSTSDSVVVFSTRAAALDEALRADFTDAVRGMSLKLARDVVAQAEGATRLIDCTVRIGTSARDAKIIAKKIVNSPLVKAAVYGGDPNWGRVVMAIGKPDERLTIRRVGVEDVTIAMMGQVVFDRGRAIPLDLAGLAARIRAATRVGVEVTIGDGRHAATVWGCDLSHRYVEINADYTT
jgi:glutamate N-acetyltransferase/amino-acid N-acetyltransferase